MSINVLHNEVGLNFIRCFVAVVVASEVVYTFYNERLLLKCHEHPVIDLLYFYLMIFRLQGKYC